MKNLLCLTNVPGFSNIIKVSENKATRSPEISRQHQKLTPPPFSTRGLLYIYPYLALFGKQDILDINSHCPVSEGALFNISNFFLINVENSIKRKMK